MSMFLFMVGLIGIVVSVIILIVNAIKKKSNKNSFIALGICVILFVIGFVSFPVEDTGDTDTQPTGNVESKKKEQSITVDQVPYEIEIREPDSIGNVYMDATYTNNTDYPITGMEMKVLLKDKNEVVYLSNYDTVMPGETSPTFDTFGPSTQNPDDCEVLNINISADVDGKTLLVEYDTKLKKYKRNKY